MPPPVEAFPAWQLEQRIQFHPDGKRRKRPINLRDCKLKELVQYDCQLRGPRTNPNSVVVCEPIVRLFRQCAGGLTVETTAVEELMNDK